jgi:hypothetical protein
MVAVLAMATAALGALGVVPARGADTRATALTPIEILSTGTFPTVYVLGSTCFGGPSCLHLVSARISGARDTPRELPPLQRFRGGLGGTTLESLQFTNGGEGYALVGTRSTTSLYVTHDGAATWHRVSAMPGVTIQRVTVTGNVLYATMATCKGFDDDCVNLTVAKSLFWPIHWTALRLPSIPNNGLNGGIPEVSADAATVWLSQWENNAEVIWRSTNEGATFHETTEPQLVSINGCSLALITPKDTWAQCPTGMLVSFFYSSDGGAHWLNVPQRPFSGTGGGFFAPAWNSTAYIDYGETPHNLYRVDMRDDAAVPVGELSCDNAESPVFMAGGDGLVVCTTEVGSKQTTSLLATSDGGAVWHKVGLET